MGSVQLHDNVSGPVCFKCSVVCKDNSNYKNHILSHYYREFDPHIPQAKPFECPICAKPSRDKITLIRHYAFTHQKMFELTDITPEQLIPPGSTPKTPRARLNKSMVESTDEMMTPKAAPTSALGEESPKVTESSSKVECTDDMETPKEISMKEDDADAKQEEITNNDLMLVEESPMVTEISEVNKESTLVQSNGIEREGETEDEVKEASMKEDDVNAKQEEITNNELMLVDDTELNRNEDEADDKNNLENDNEIEESIPDQEILEENTNTEAKAALDTEKKESLESDPSANKENEEEVL